MKKILIGLGVLIGLVLLTWGICETVNSDRYDYQGYVIDVGQDDKGNTTIVALSGNKESCFTVKWYTKKTAPKKQAVAVGDRIMLTTTHGSDTNIKKMKIDVGYSTEGRLVYVDGLVSPFILATHEDTGERYLVSIISRDDMLTNMDIGDRVRVFHMSPIYTSTPSIGIEAVKLITDGSIEDLTEEDIAFIRSEGYTVRGSAE